MNTEVMCQKMDPKMLQTFCEQNVDDFDLTQDANKNIVGDKKMGLFVQHLQHIKQ